VISVWLFSAVAPHNDSQMLKMRGIEIRKVTEGLRNKKITSVFLSSHINFGACLLLFSWKYPVFP